jgi:hypothetical protein
MRDSLLAASSKDQKKIIADLMAGAVFGGGSGKSDGYTDVKDDWHSVVSEVSTPDVHKVFPSDGRSGRSRLLAGMAVLKHGRSGGTQSRVLKIDSNGDRLYWLDVKKSSAALDAKKSVLLKDVLKVQPGVKYVRGPHGSKQCIPSCTAILSRNCNLDQLKRCISLVLPERTFDIQCINDSDFVDLHAALLNLTNPYS